MLEALKQGVVGLALFASQWLSPGQEQAGLYIESVRKEGKKYEVECKMDLAWNSQMEKLVDAGIPMQFKITAITDAPDTQYFYRTLDFNMVNYTYTFTDSEDITITRHKEYPLVLLALKDYCRWKMIISENSRICRIEAVLLPSRVSRLNRMVDMSRIWGQEKVYTVFDPSERVNKKQ